MYTTGLIIKRFLLKSNFLTVRLHELQDEQTLNKSGKMLDQKTEDLNPNDKAASLILIFPMFSAESLQARRP